MGPFSLRILLFLLSSFIPARTPPNPKLVVTPLNDRVLVHTTYGLYQGNAVPSNGLIIKTGNGVVLVDTGWDSEGNTENTQQLLQWVVDSLHQPVRLCIVTHAHDDRVGGINALKKAGIRVVSTPLTAQKTVKQGYASPDPVLSNDTTFTVGRVPIRCFFPGEGHTSDNIVVWLPNERILHGGCFIKSVVADGMGNVADANLSEWPNAIRRVMHLFGTAKIVVPGHDAWSDTKALQHTLDLLKNQAAAKR